MPKDLKILALTNTILVPKFDKTTSFTTETAALVQRIVKCLFTEPGSDIQFPEFGVGLQKVLPATYDTKEFDKTKMSVTECILRCEKQIKEDDTSSTDSPKSKLSSLQLQSLSYSKESLQWVVELVMRNGYNQAFVFKTGTQQ